MKKKRNYFAESALMNNSTYRYFYDWLVELAVSMYKWENLPEPDDEKVGVDSNFLEYTLFYKGKALFLNDEVLGYICTDCNLESQQNIYYIPKNRTAISIDYRRDCTDKDSVVIFNNVVHTPTSPTINLFARRLTDIQRTMDINIGAQKTPVLINCSENEKLTLENAYMKYEGNQPVIMSYKEMNIADKLMVFKTDAPYVADKLQAQKIQVWNEALSFLGISNVNYEKRERLVKEEVISSMGGTLASRNTRLSMRQRAAKEINKMFDQDISVVYNEEIGDIIQNAENAIIGGLSR